MEIDPGWRWSEHERPEIGTPSCRPPHLGYVVSGVLRIAMDDGPELEAGAGQGFDVPPGHDAWTVGDQACIFVDFAATRRQGP